MFVIFVYSITIETFEENNEFVIVRVQISGQKMAVFLSWATRCFVCSLPRSQMSGPNAVGKRTPTQLSLMLRKRKRRKNCLKVGLALANVDWMYEEIQ